eukprot:Unigene5948_Nuclearia_a/m.18214 Unigene5948_Nuclearia_a/g.18214  ORF Unigene5948_Nuclearia_a/g.18214 Unigene5948_Nuclearia_a/m.18214 type:complete len:277 (-) Unigene5948_Nuclearia_a:232-1062(-)
MKDMNFVNSKKKIKLGPEKHKLFVEQIQSDAKFLAENNIMDYSLLLGIHDLDRGNKEELRTKGLSVLQPQAPLHNVDPTKEERRQIKKAIKRAHPEALGPDNNPLPQKLPQEQTISVFSQDDGGFQSTDEDNRPLSEIYFMGIIDILTPYDIKKRIEHQFKAFNHNEYEISAIEPSKYAERFTAFLVGGTVVIPRDKGKARRRMLGRTNTTDSDSIDYSPSGSPSGMSIHGSGSSAAMGGGPSGGPATTPPPGAGMVPVHIVPASPAAPPPELLAV